MVSHDIRVYLELDSQLFRTEEDLAFGFTLYIFRTVIRNKKQKAERYDFLQLGYCHCVLDTGHSDLRIYDQVPCLVLLTLLNYSPQKDLRFAEFLYKKKMTLDLGSTINRFTSFVLRTGIDITISHVE